MHHGNSDDDDASMTVDAYFRCLGSAYQIANDILNFQGNDGAEAQASDLGRRAPNAVTLIYRHMLPAPNKCTLTNGIGQAATRHLITGRIKSLGRAR